MWHCVSSETLLVFALPAFIITDVAVNTSVSGTEGKKKTNTAPFAEGGVQSVTQKKQQHTNKETQTNVQYLSVLVINHDIVGLDVSVHDSHTVAVIQGLRRQDSLILLIFHVFNVWYYWMRKQWNYNILERKNPKKYRKCP